MEDLVRQFAHERQMIAAYASLSREHMARARELELRIQRKLERKPLSKREISRLTTLIETGEIVFVPNAEDDSPPF